MENENVVFNVPKLESRLQDLSKKSSVPLLYIDIHGYDKLNDVGLDINNLFALHLCILGTEMVAENYQGMLKFTSWLDKLIRKQLITEDFKPTLSGIAFYESLIPDAVTPPKPKKTDDFERWWKTWPATDKLELPYKSFSMTRTIRTGRAMAALKFNKIMNEGEYTADELINVLKLEIAMKVEESHKTGQNQIKFLSGPVPYLNQRKFEALIEQAREDATKPAKKQGYSGNTMQI